MDSDHNQRTIVWTHDVAGAWLVKITPAGDFKTVTFKSITKARYEPPTCVRLHSRIPVQECRFR